MKMYSAIIEVLEEIEKDGTIQNQRAEAHRLLEDLETFEFVFCLYLMVKILGFTNELNLALQKRDQEIVNAISLVSVAKKKLQLLRDEGWDLLLDDISSFCNENDIPITNMEDTNTPRRRLKGSHVSNLHHYKVDLFNSIIDIQLQELCDRFSEASTELLLCVACLSPYKSFHAFEEGKLLKMAEFYPSEFSAVELVALRNQLGNYIVDVCQDTRFVSLNGIGDLAKKMVETNKHIIYPMVFLLLKLALILTVATSSMERSFSAMKLIKSDLRNKMGDQFLNDCLVPYTEKDVFDGISNDTIATYFQGMKTRREQL